MVDDEAGLNAFAEAVGWPLVLKTPRGGYDGRGVRLVESAAQAQDWLARLAPGEQLLAEERVAFVRELAVLVARSPMGQASAWPVVETVQVGGICTEVLAPAPGLSPTLAASATAAALQIAGPST
jgi:5-(carboxyamino)imidazole ribonucleotide synthase